MHAVRRLAMLTFEHMHLLSLRFHLERKTGGLTRVLERGRNGIETIVRMVLLQLAPTVVEVVLIVWVLLFHFDWRYVMVIVCTVALYVGFTFYATEWRIGIRRKMNESDTDANAKAINSLLNYETVKYFSAEEREAKRYDRSMARYEDASVKAYTSLAVLNAGQAIIFAFGLAAAMVLCATGVERGTNTVGDFVMINAMMIQLYQPLNFMGLLYREIKQAVIDIEIMFAILERKPEIEDAEDARALKVRAGTIRFDNVSFAYEPARPILKGLNFEVPAGHTVAIVGPSGAGKSTLSRLIFRFYDVTGGRILIDGVDVREVTQASLRAAIGMVPQDTVLFNDTIRYNIRRSPVRLSAGRRRPHHRLRQDDPCLPDGGGDGQPAGDRALRRADAERLARRPTHRLRHRGLEIPRKAGRRRDRLRGIHEYRGLVGTIVRPLQYHGHRLDDEFAGRGARDVAGPRPHLRGVERNSPRDGRPGASRARWAMGRGADGAGALASSDGDEFLGVEPGTREMRPRADEEVRRDAAPAARPGPRRHAPPNRELARLLEARREAVPPGVLGAGEMTE